MTQTVLITGSSSGIGQATAQLFAQQGWNVAATARKPADLSSLVGANALAHPLDVTDETSIAAAVAATTARFGGIDILVNYIVLSLYFKQKALKTRLYYDCDRAVIFFSTFSGGKLYNGTEEINSISLNEG